MTTIGFFLFFLWVASFASAFILTKDLYSPPVMFSVVAGLFYSDIFFNEYSQSVICIYIIILLCILLGTTIYGRFKVKKLNSFQFFNAHIPIISIWILTLPSFLAQLYFINKFGGLAGYALAAKFGTYEFYGLGHIKTTISTIYPIGLSYYAYILVTPNSKSKNFIFSLHFILVIAIALLTLSRGTLFNHLLLMLVIRNLIKKKISKLFVVSALSCALVFASLYGVVRESFNYSEDDSFTLGIDNKEEKFKTEWMEFGTFPLSKVTAVNNVDLTFGATYLTVFTNFVPRFFWPSKPDPGGVVFTRDYAPGLYDEYSQYTTGIFPEAIINFGIYFGTFLGVFQLISFFILISFFHIKYFSNLFIVNSHKNIFFVVGYVYSLWAFPIFLTGEFTNIAIGLIIKFLVLMLCYSYLRLSKFT